MSGIYYTEAADWLRAIGITVHELDGWQTRARSSGGFPNPGALGVQWHHTASSTTPENDTRYMFFSAQDRPIGNMLLDRAGEAWLGAAGAANTAGKGGPLTLSRGTIPTDGANARTWAIEAANNGVGEPWPTRQIDAYYAISNELNRRFGNQPSDIFNHQTWAPTRKIDPATAAGVQGGWRPASSTSSGTWRQSDVTAEAIRRAGNAPTPTPPTPVPPPDPDPGDDDMTNEQFTQLMSAFNTLNARIQSLVEDMNKVEPRVGSLVDSNNQIAARCNAILNDVDRLADKLVGPD